jgi:ABC-type sugar transport system ATPase subunit
MSELKVINLSKSFGSTPVLNNISFDVREGEFCILLGPSGCGKTTMLRLIAGLDQQDKGEIFIGDKEVSNLPPRQRDIAMVFQSYALYPHMNVYENMGFALKIQKLNKDQTARKVREAAMLLGIEDLLGRKPRELSGGQRQRVAIGRAIVRDPRLFLFDEPLSNLDAKLRSNMRVELAKLHQKLNSTIVYVTHDQVEAMTLGQKIILLDNGRIQQIGTPEEMYHKPENIFVARFIGTPQINLIEGTIINSEKGLLFTSESLTVSLGKIDELIKYAGEQISLAVRPESLVPGEGQIAGIVELTEHLGSETLVYVRVESSQLTVKGPANFQVAEGSSISLSLRGTGIHFFHKDKRINVSPKFFGNYP